MAQPFACPNCNKTFKGKIGLRRHMHLHTGVSPYQCDHCMASFGYIGNLKRHLRIHTGEKPFSCKICSRQFSDDSHRKSHERIHCSEDSLSKLDSSASSPASSVDDDSPATPEDQPLPASPLVPDAKQFPQPPPFRYFPPTIDPSSVPTFPRGYPFPMYMIVPKLPVNGMCPTPMPFPVYMMPHLANQYYPQSVWTIIFRTLLFPMPRPFVHICVIVLVLPIGFDAVSQATFPHFFSLIEEFQKPTPTTCINYELLPA